MPARGRRRNHDGNRGQQRAEAAGAEGGNVQAAGREKDHRAREPRVDAEAVARRAEPPEERRQPDRQQQHDANVVPAFTAHCFHVAIGSSTWDSSVPKLSLLRAGERSGQQGGRAAVKAGRAANGMPSSSGAISRSAQQRRPFQEIDSADDEGQLLQAKLLLREQPDGMARQLDVGRRQPRSRIAQPARQAAHADRVPRSLRDA